MSASGYQAHGAGYYAEGKGRTVLNHVGFELKREILGVRESKERQTELIECLTGFVILTFWTWKRTGRFQAGRKILSGKDRPVPEDHDQG